MHWRDPSVAGRDPAAAHGGNLAAARARFPDAPEPWIDLSTGINPLRYPVLCDLLAESVWTRLPEPMEIAQLEAVAAAAYDVARHGRLVAANGTQPLIQILPQLIPARRVAILGFGYQEHPARWRAAGAQVSVVETVEELEAGDVDLALVVNPNNPDGRLVDAIRLTDVAQRLAARGGYLVVDEAFMDVVRPSQSLAPVLPDNTILLRSFGKAYGLAGLRLGFAIADPGIADRLRDMLGPWPVSGPAIAIGSAALSDRDWLERILTELDLAGTRLDNLLGAAGLTLAGGTRLFRLVVSPEALRWHERLGHDGILTRPFAERPEWLRVGLPSEAAAWQRLQAALLG